MMRRFTRFATVFIVGVAVASCDATDAVAIRIELESDLSGKVSTRSLVQPSSAGKVELGSTGVAWADRVNLVAAQGSFRELSALRIEDIVFSAGTADGTRFVKVTVPLGAAVKWPATFTIPDRTQRQRAAATLESSGEAKRAGATLKIEIELPATVVSHGAKPQIGGLSEVVRKRVASLVVPVDEARAAEGNLVWLLGW